MLSQVNLEDKWWAADVGFGSQVPRQPVPLQAEQSDAAPEPSDMFPEGISPRRHS